MVDNRPMKRETIDSARVVENAKDSIQILIQRRSQLIRRLSELRKLMADQAVLIQRDEAELAELDRFASKVRAGLDELPVNGNGASAPRSSKRLDYGVGVNTVLRLLQNAADPLSVARIAWLLQNEWNLKVPDSSIYGALDILAQMKEGKRHAKGANGPRYVLRDEFRKVKSLSQERIRALRQLRKAKGTLSQLNLLTVPKEK